MGFISQELITDLTLEVPAGSTEYIKVNGVISQVLAAAKLEEPGLTGTIQGTLDTPEFVDAGGDALWFNLNSADTPVTEITDDTRFDPIPAPNVIKIENTSSGGEDSASFEGFIPNTDPPLEGVFSLRAIASNPEGSSFVFLTKDQGLCYTNSIETPTVLTPIVSYLDGEVEMSFGDLTIENVLYVNGKFWAMGADKYRGHPIVLKSDDGENNWTGSTRTDSYSTVINMVWAGSNTYVGIGGPFVYYTNNAWETFSIIDLIPTEQGFPLNILSDNNGTVVVATYNEIMYSTSGGAPGTWNTASVTNGSFFQMGEITAGVYYNNTFYFTKYSTTDSYVSSDGISWQKSDSIVPAWYVSSYAILGGKLWAIVTPSGSPLIEVYSTENVASGWEGFSSAVDTRFGYGSFLKSSTVGGNSIYTVFDSFSEVADDSDFTLIKITPTAGGEGPVIRFSLRGNR